MSIALLIPKLNTNQSLRDDLESFLWVLLFLIMRYRPIPDPAWLPVLVQECLLWLFDEHKFDKLACRDSGGQHKRFFLLTGEVDGHDMMDALVLPQPFYDTIQSLRELFRGFHTQDSEAIDRLSTHSYVQGIFKDHIAKLKLSKCDPDPAEDQIAGVVMEIGTSFKEEAVRADVVRISFHSKTENQAMNGSRTSHSSIGRSGSQVSGASQSSRTSNSTSGSGKKRHHEDVDVDVTPRKKQARQPPSRLASGCSDTSAGAADPEQAEQIANDPQEEAENQSSDNNVS